MVVLLRRLGSNALGPLATTICQISVVDRELVLVRVDGSRAEIDDLRRRLVEQGIYDPKTWPRKRLYPKDSEKFLKMLPHYFWGAYLWAEEVKEK